MPIQVRKLTTEELNDVLFRSSGIDLTEYREHLQGFRVGEYGSIDVGDESKGSVKNRFSKAASSLGLQLKWHRTRDANTLGFQVTELKPKAERTEPSRRGRPRKAA